MNMAKRGGPDAHAEGLLLYPCTDGHGLRLEFQLIDHKVCAFTVDLTKPWPHIHEELLTMILRQSCRRDHCESVRVRPASGVAEPVTGSGALSPGGGRTHRPTSTGGYG